MSKFISYIGSLSDSLVDLVKGLGISQNIYIEHGPEAVNNVPDDFVIITYPLAMTNKGPWQKHQIRFEMICKDMANKRANIHKLEDQMVNPLLEKFPINFDRFTLFDPYVRMKGSDGLGHTSWTIQCDCIVNTTDKFSISTDDGSTATT